MFRFLYKLQIIKIKSYKMDKHIKINKPMPEQIRKAIEAKREWMKKVQSGEVSAGIEKNLKMAN